MKKILLTQNKYALVDDEDFERVNQIKWFASKSHNKFYASHHISSINGKRKAILMHRFILGIDQEIDHINNDSLDNRKENMRICTHSENLRNKKIYKNNKSGYKGVYFEPSTNKYRTVIRLNKKNIHIGRFNTASEAGFAYNLAALHYFKEFARLNDYKY